MKGKLKRSQGMEDYMLDIEGLSISQWTTSPKVQDAKDELF